MTLSYIAHDPKPVSPSDLKMLRSMPATALGVPGAAEWLDRTYPGWYAKINLGAFDMGLSWMCIGHYIGVDWDADLADVYSRETGRPSFGLFADFTDEWKEEIVARREWDLGIEERRSWFRRVTRL